MDPENLDLPTWVQWLAQDANGSWWGYEAEPHQHDSGWYENEIGRHIRLFDDKPCRDWQKKLLKVTK